MDDARIVEGESYGMSKEDARYVEWYEIRMEELQAGWLERINPEDFEEYWEWVHEDYAVLGDDPDDRSRDYDQWYRVHSIDLQSRWLASIDPTDFDPFWDYVESEYNSER